MTITDEAVEAACRAWWDAPGPDGKRIATIPWDECHFFDKTPYRLRMRAALEAVA